ncbi:hypothetical protein [uncultured Tateyamaria sp.]|uniref:hypothetical protein n=1 Tax=uncultured Tateyamaria sp. TaxID=455651 RepID=UPI00260C924B|nr:hypothetical protein [uncultured Tateyamaria sp.]
MKQIAVALCLVISATSVPAQETEEDRGLSLMERGAQMLMEGLMREMEPAMEGLQDMAEEFGPALRDFTAQMGPALRDLLEEVEDWSVYHPPEILENGDIIIRRKTPQELKVEPTPDAQIDI